MNAVARPSPERIAAAAEELLKRRRARQHFMPYVRYMNPHYIVAPHNELLAQHLEDVERGVIKRLMVTMPPRHGKSQLVSRHFPAWFLGRNPRKDVISASFGQDLATDFSRDVRDQIADPKYSRILFPGVTLAADSQAKNRWHTNAGGGYVAAGVGTAVTGRGADLLNIDDPLKDRLEAESSVTREAVWAWYRSVAYTRLMPGAAIVLTLTRWHEEDLAGKAIQQELEGGDKWVRLDLPAINEHGEALWPARYDETTLAQIRATIGEYDWNALYMQRPRPPGGSFFTEESLLEMVEGSVVVDAATGKATRPKFRPVEFPLLIDTVYAVIDTAMKTGKTHDGLAVAYFGTSRYEQTKYPLYILDWDLKQVQGSLLEAWLPTVFTRLGELAALCRARFGSSGAFIEDKVSGTILLQQTEGKFDVHPLDNDLVAMGKSERAMNVSGYVHQGKCKITQHAYDRVVSFKGVTQNHFLKQVLGFRAGTKEDSPDDCLDTFTYGVAIALGNQAGF